MDEQELIQNPEALLALVQQAVQHLIEQRPDTAAQEAQLRAVAKAITELEKLNVPIPNSLRQTKMTLIAEIGQQDQFVEQIKILGEGLTDVLEIIETCLGHPPNEDKNDKASTKPIRRRRSNGLRTPHAILKDYVFAALTDLGGSAKSSEVLDRVEESFKDKLLPGDIDPHKSYAAIWRYNAHWAYQKLIHEGIANRSPRRGYWELNPDYDSDNKKQAYSSI
ncbi:MAG: hypothetical protein QG599_3487 [Pseudomonadota bacterium]|nr:hypothetical protein [Pseudomonadota bacterium]